MADAQRKGRCQKLRPLPREIAEESYQKIYPMPRTSQNAERARVTFGDDIRNIVSNLMKTTAVDTYKAE